MITKAKASYIRISPRKLRYVVDLVRDKSVPEALSILERTDKKGGPIINKCLKSACDAALKNKKIGEDRLYVSKIFADSAGMFKRWRAMSMGRAGVIRKRLSHLTIELDILNKKLPARYVNAVEPVTETKPKKRGRSSKAKKEE